MTIVEFSRRLGLSTATVSRAFSGNGRISPKTRQYVQAQARELGYHPNLQARNMVRKQSDTIAFFYDAPEKLDSDYYVGELTCGIHDAARTNGRFLQTCTAPPGSTGPTTMMLNLIHGRSIDGFILNLLQSWSEPLIAAAEERGIPCVIIDDTRPYSSEFLSLGSQIQAAAVEAGAHLLSLGRRCPAMIRGIHDACKLAGLREGLGDLAANLDIHVGGKTFQDGYDAAKALLARQPGLDAIFAANDVLAIGAIRALLDAGRRVPGDIAVIGCDDLAMARFVDPPLTTIRLPKYDMGYLAVRKLLALIRKEPMAAQSTLVCELIRRQSA